MTALEPVARVTLLTQTDCGLCEHAKKVLARVGSDYQLDVTEVSLATERGQTLARENGVVFAPGVLLDDAPFGYGRLSERRFRRVLNERASSTTSENSQRS